MKMPEAPVILIGQVFRSIPKTNFETKETEGVKLAVLGGDGATEVTVKNGQLAVPAIPGDQVAWLVRPFPYAMDGASGVSFQFVAPVDLGTIDNLHNIVAGTTVSK